MRPALPPAAGIADELGHEYAICDRECRALAAHLDRRPHLSAQEAETYKALLRRRARIADEWRMANGDGQTQRCGPGPDAGRRHPGTDLSLMSRFLF